MFSLQRTLQRQDCKRLCIGAGPDCDSGGGRVTVGEESYWSAWHVEFHSWCSCSTWVGSFRLLWPNHSSDPTFSMCRQMKDASCAGISTCKVLSVQGPSCGVPETCGEMGETAPGKGGKGKGVRVLVPVGYTNFPTGYLNHKSSWFTTAELRFWLLAPVLRHAITLQVTK